MPRFTVRTNCEYSITVDASDADTAMAKAGVVDLKDWDQAWAPAEAEED